MKKYICGATGRECPYKAKDNGEMPCGECDAGKAFRELFKGQPELHDDN